MTAPAAILRFGRFELQSHERRLLMDGAPVPIGARSFDLLLALAERAGRLVDKRQLMDLVWPGLVVQENNLAAQMSALRKVLGGDVIATIPGRGYRFVARIESVPGEQGKHGTHSAGNAGSAEGAPAAAPGGAPRTNLPAELPPLFGRADELDALGALLERYRLVSVVGAGGIGKSLLTQHLLQAQRGRYADGVCWVELAAVADAAALPGAVATALGVDGGRGEPLAALVAAVAPLELLLALDNAEHLIDGLAHLAQALHDAAPRLRIVVTSQAPLRLAAERVLRLGPLAVPPRALPAAEALRYGAVALFAERALAAGRSFALDGGNAPQVIELCRALDGLPLAIELAAARVPSLGIVPLLAQMRDRLRLLTRSPRRTAPGRQLTLRAALDWSHALLAPREQTVLRRLAVIAGSGSLDFIEQVLHEPAAGLDRFGVLDALDALVERSWLVVLSAPEDAEPRYRLLESPRAYAMERLEEAGERAALERRHALALAERFEAAYAEFFSGRVGSDDWLHRCEADLDNAREALRWARAAGDGEVELRIACTLLRALPPTLHVERQALADAVEARIDAPGGSPLELRACIELACMLADTQKARSRRFAERALQLARAGEVDRFTLYHALCRAASSAAQGGDLDLARVQLAELERLEDPAWPAQRRIWGAEVAQWVARVSGDTGEALRIGRRLLVLDRERGSNGAIATGNLVDTQLAAGDVRGAAESGAALVAALSGTRHEYALAFAHVNWLAALLALGEREQAGRVAQVVWSKAPAFDLQHATAAYLALLAALEGRPRAAARLAGYSEAVYAARDEVREANETRATERALGLAREALGAAEVERLRAAGAALGDAEIAGLAFGGPEDGAEDLGP